MDKINTCHLLLQMANITLFINRQLTNKDPACILFHVGKLPVQG